MIHILVKETANFLYTHEMPHPLELLNFPIYYVFNTN